MVRVGEGGSLNDRIRPIALWKQPFKFLKGTHKFIFIFRCQ